MVETQNGAATAPQLPQPQSSAQVAIPPAAHHTAWIDEVRMHFVKTGQGDAAVLLLHGWAETWYQWRRVIPTLAEKYTVIAPDMRGFGDSSKPATGYDQHTMAEDAYKLVRHLGFERVHVVGQDWGAAWGYDYACNHPEGVLSLTLLEFPIPDSSWGKFPIFVDKPDFTWWMAFLRVPDVPEMLLAGREREFLTWVYRQFAYNPAAITNEDIDEYMRTYETPGGMRVLAELYRAIYVTFAQNEQNAKTKLKMPVLALGGEANLKDLLYEQTKTLAEDVRGGTVPACSHWIPEERPDYLLEQLQNLFSYAEGDGSQAAVRGRQTATAAT